jgi:predicted nucleotidyltransferase
MDVDIKNYQEAYDIAIKKFKANSQILAAIVHGSIVTGDICAGSDLDFVVITKESDKNEYIYSKIKDISIHINYISKNIFLEYYSNILKGGTFHKVFFTGKLAFCLDSELKEIYLSTKVYCDRDRAVRNIEILCNLINSVHYLKKYYSNGKAATSYQWYIEVLKNYARLVMSMNGYLTDKDILSLAVNMNSNVEYLFHRFISNAETNEKIDEILNFVDNYILMNIEGISSPIIYFLKENKFPCSVQDIKGYDAFKNIDGDLNLLLEKLSCLKMIKETTRTYSNYGNEYFIDEVVYYI